MGTSSRSDDLLDAVRRARSILSTQRLPGTRVGTREELTATLGELRALVDEATALQDEVIVGLASIEPERAEDGTVREVRRAPGHVALDAPAIVSGVLCLSAIAAEQRVRDAVRRAADGPEGTATETGLGGLHAAMGQGRLDASRAHVVAAELEECPVDVRRTVVAALDEWFEREDAARLRRRVRRLVAAIDPDLLRQRAERARAATGLRRWVDEPGVDTWLGTFPSEEARGAWAAIDALAQRYVDDGTCARIDRARARALTDLVLQQATVTTTVVEHDAHPVTGALLDTGDALATTAYRPGAALAALVRARDGHCRFPGCSVAARWCDLDHVVPWPAGPTSALNLVCLCRRHHRTKQRPGWLTRLEPDGTYTVTDPTGGSARPPRPTTSGTCRRETSLRPTTSPPHRVGPGSPSRTVRTATSSTRSSRSSAATGGDERPAGSRSTARADGSPSQRPVTTHRAGPRPGGPTPRPSEIFDLSDTGSLSLSGAAVSAPQRTVAPVLGGSTPRHPVVARPRDLTQLPDRRPCQDRPG